MWQKERKVYNRRKGMKFDRTKERKMKNETKKRKIV